MGQRPRRGKSEYFDLKLVELVEGLWKSAATVQDGRAMLFPKTSNNKLRPGKVRELFKIDENYYSAWKFNDWKKLGAHQPRTFAETLAIVFRGGDYSDDFPNDEVLRINLLHRHWQQYCTNELQLVQVALTRHLVDVRTAFAKQEHEVEREPARPAAGMEPPRIVPNSHPLDLSPPPCLDRVLRPVEFENASALARTHFGVVIQGRPKCGKRYLAQALATSANGRSRVLWFNLASGTTLQHVLTRLERIDPPLDAPLDRAVSALTEWLTVNDILLVLAGIDRANASSFAPLLQILPRLSGPSHVIATSNVRYHGLHVHEVEPLTGEEAIDLLTGLGIAHSRGEIRALARELALAPFVLRQAAVPTGVLEVQQIRLGMDRLHAQIVHELSPELRAVFEVLHILATDLDLALAGEVLTALGFETPPLQMLELLEERLLLRRTGAAVWHVEAGKLELATRFIAPDRLRSVLVHLAAYFRRRVERGGRIPRPLGDDDWPRLLAACRLLQLADAERPQREWLRNQLTPIAERRGAYQQLVAIYEYEVALGDSPDAWLPFRFARLLFVLGRYRQSVAVIDQVFHGLAGETERNEDLYWSVVRLLSEILIEVGRPDLAARLIDALFQGAEISELSSSVCTQTASVLSWALVKSGDPEACLQLNRIVLDDNFEGMAHPFSLHVSKIRVGVALRVQERLSESIAALEAAYGYFRVHDARAFAWCAVNLALALYEAGELAKATLVLGSAMAVNASHGFHNGEMLAAYRTFRSDEACILSHPAIDAELDRLAAFEPVLGELGHELADSKLVEHVLLDLGGDLAAPFTFEVSRYELFSLSAPPAIASTFGRTMVSRLRSAGIESIVDGIFKSKPAHEILRNPIYNRLIGESCKQNRILHKKFITPHIDIIGQQTDSVIFFFSRLLESLGIFEESTSLLNQIKNKECFEYYNILANCTSHHDAFSALKLNDDALNFARSRKRTAQIFHNKASIVYDNTIRRLFQSAEDWCEEAIRLRREKFPYPRNLLLLFKLARSSLPDVEDTILAHLDRFHTPKKVLERILRDIKSEPLRRRALEAVERLPS